MPLVFQESQVLLVKFHQAGAPPPHLLGELPAKMQNQVEYLRLHQTHGSRELDAAELPQNALEEIVNSCTKHTPDQHG